MAKVRRLDPLVAERIAAGEVVERPASVVKELVENSLDAGATQIQVELLAGGAHLLRVIDDGCGMSAEDVRLGLERFATSKISQWEDLDQLTTLGFRGEALPSIAAVSKMEIHTCEADCLSGTRVRVEGGVVVEEAPAAPLRGTRVEVAELFYNTPARLKFLKSAAAETGQVVDLLTRMALTRPGIHFQVRSNQREVLLVTAKMNLAQRLALLWRVPLEDLVLIQGEQQGVVVEGWVALPQHARPTRNHQLFSLNGRLIRSTSLSQAVLEGFTPLVSKGRFPVALLQLQVDPSTIDVNVHPTKAEVRFLDARAPFRAIYRSIAQALEARSADPVQPQHWQPADSNSHNELDRVLESVPDYQYPPLPVLGVSPDTPPRTPTDSGSRGDCLSPPRTPLHSGSRGDYPSPPRTPLHQFGPPQPPRQPIGATLAMFQPLELAPQGPKVKVLTQLYRTFIVAQVEGELWLVDQHTAHERIWYERLGHVQPLDGPQQGLLVPEVVEFSPTQAAWLEGSLAEVVSLGLEVEAFGGTSFQIRSLPLGIKPGRAAPILRSLVEQALSDQYSLVHHPREIVREKLRAMMSCKAAIKSGDLLSQEEMESLIAELLTVEHSNYCPHGRPTRVKLDDKALERLFHR